VNRVAPQAELLDYCKGLLRRILANGPVAVALTIQAVDAGLASGFEQGLQFEAAAFGVAAGTRDRVEGTRAFLEKRTARFSGR
jgi:enoyl-CoA hydratase